MRDESGGPKNYSNTAGIGGMFYNWLGLIDCQKEFKGV